MPATATESALQNWQDGHTKAERLAAAILHLEGFKDIDPQQPRGGPDGKKDVLCTRDGVPWVAAVYFPSTAVTFATIKRKFVHDTGALRPMAPPVSPSS